MNLSLTDNMPFGKYKGQAVNDVFKSDPGYLIWLREERKTANFDSRFFGLAVSTLLDAAITGSSHLKRKFKPWNLPINQEPVKPVVAVRELEKEVAYHAWGEF